MVGMTHFVNIVCPLFTIIGLYLLGAKNKHAFTVMSGVQVVLIFRLLSINDYGLVLMSIIYILFNVWNFIKWGRAE